ncbi:MAG: DUF4124 domain-containing protein [Pseudomonadota bacterium]
MSNKLLIIAICALIPCMTSAKIYKYVDENGKVVYSQTKPKGQKVRELKNRARSVSNEEAQKRLEALRNKAQNSRQNKQLLDKGKDEADALAKREQENCSQAKKNLEILNNSPRVQATDANGKLFYLDSDGLQAKKDEAQAQVKEFCK